jgi:xylan 1,4-beta-xylosidase
MFHPRHDDGLHLSAGYMVELAPEGRSVTGEPGKVYGGWEYPDTFNMEGFCLEAPKLTKRNGYYYRTSAEEGTAGPATSHMIVSARSRTPRGPWENSPYNPIVHTESAAETWWSKGHGTLVSTPDERWWILYHGYEKGYYTLGRQTLLEPVEWVEDGWFRIPPQRLQTLPQSSRRDLCCR